MSRQHDLTEPIPLREVPRLLPLALAQMAAVDQEGVDAGALCALREPVSDVMEAVSVQAEAPDLRRRVGACTRPYPRLCRGRQEGEHRGGDGKRQEAAESWGGGSPHARTDRLRGWPIESSVRVTVPRRSPAARGA
jgi:hypothetical protein